MWSKFLFFSFFLCIQFWCMKSAPSDNTKAQQIAELASRSKGNVITLDDATFNYYAVSKPRTYSLVVFLTAAHPKFKCSICKVIDKELSLLAQSYATETAKRGEQAELFFIRMDYESAQKTFQSYDVNSVPVLFHIAPQVSSSSDRTSAKDYAISIRDKYQVPPDVTAESLASFIRDRTGISIAVQRSHLFSYISILVVFIVLLALVRPVINALPIWLPLLQNKYIWMVVSLGIYTCAISGLIFDIIRSPQMYYANPQTGQIMFFYPHSGNQFVVEGFVIGFLNLACSIALVFLAVYAIKLKDEQSKAAAMVAAVVAFIFCFRMVRGLYIMKNQWYGRA